MSGECFFCGVYAILQKSAVEYHFAVHSSYTGSSTFVSVYILNTFPCIFKFEIKSICNTFTPI